MRDNDTPKGLVARSPDEPLRLPPQLAPHLDLLKAALHEVEDEVPGGLYNLSGASLRTRRRALGAIVAVRQALWSRNASTRARMEALWARLPGGKEELSQVLDRFIHLLRELVWWRLSSREEQDEAFACLEAAEAELAALETPNFDRKEVRRAVGWGWSEARLSRYIENMDPYRHRRRWFKTSKALIEAALDDSLETVGPYAPWLDLVATRRAERRVATRVPSPAKPPPSPRRGRGRLPTRDNPEWRLLVAWVEDLKAARGGGRWAWKAEWELVCDELNQRPDLKERWGRLVPLNPDSWADKRRKNSA